MSSDVKAQPVRLFDVFLLGPVMIVSSAYVKDPVLRAILAVGGVGTVVYNASNYVKVRKRA